MQLTNAEVDKAKAIREIMKNGVVGDGLRELEWEDRKVLFNRSLLIMQQLQGLPSTIVKRVGSALKNIFLFFPEIT